MLITSAVLVGLLLSPPSVREKEPPAGWKLAEFNALLPNPDDAGPVSILVWEVIDNGEVLGRTERCLVVKKYTKPKGGDICAIGFLERNLDLKEDRWKPRTIYGTGVKPGDPNKIVGVDAYRFLPTDEDIAAFLKRFWWEGDFEPGELNGGRAAPGRKEKYFPKLTDGGLCPAAWKKVFDRQPPATLFPELVVVPTAKK